MGSGSYFTWDPWPRLLVGPFSIAWPKRRKYGENHRRNLGEG